MAVAVASSSSSAPILARNAETLRPLLEAISPIAQATLEVPQQTTYANVFKKTHDVYALHFEACTKMVTEMQTLLPEWTQRCLNISLGVENPSPDMLRKEVVEKLEIYLNYRAARTLIATAIDVYMAANTYFQQHGAPPRLDPTTVEHLRKTGVIYTPDDRLHGDYPQQKEQLTTEFEQLRKLSADLAREAYALKKQLELASAKCGLTLTLREWIGFTPYTDKLITVLINVDGNIDSDKKSQYLEGHT